MVEEQYWVSVYELEGTNVYTSRMDGLIRSTGLDDLMCDEHGNFSFKIF